MCFLETISHSMQTFCLFMCVVLSGPHECSVETSHAANGNSFLWPGVHFVTQPLVHHDSGPYLSQQDPSSSGLVTVMDWLTPVASVCLVLVVLPLLVLLLAWFAINIFGPSHLQNTSHPRKWLDRHILICWFRTNEAENKENYVYLGQIWISIWLNTDLSSLENMFINFIKSWLYLWFHGCI